MGDDLDKKIKQITDILGQENLPENLMGLLGMISSSPAKESPRSSAESGAHDDFRQIGEESQGGKGEMEDPALIMRKLKKVMDRANTKNDPRINLLNAIRPFMRTSRQKNLSNCIKILTVSSMTRYLDEFDKENI